MSKPTPTPPPPAPAPLAQQIAPATMSDFFTRGKSNEGARLQLVAPDGRLTDAWIDVYGVDSDIFQRAKTDSQRALIRYLETHGDEKEVRLSPEFEDFTQEQKRRLRASLVKGWSFDKPCDLDSVVAFFREAPGVADAVDEFASKRSRFAGA